MWGAILVGRVARGGYREIIPLAANPAAGARVRVALVWRFTGTVGEDVTDRSKPPEIRCRGIMRDIDHLRTVRRVCLSAPDVRNALSIGVREDNQTAVEDGVRGWSLGWVRRIWEGRVVVLGARNQE
jgi:hypothetical protein